MIMTRPYFGLLAICLLFILGVESTLDQFYQQDFDTSNKIYNGKPANPKRHRWMAWLYDDDKNKMICGGSLVGENWVMTTATCASKKFNNVVVGDYNVYKPDGEQCIPVHEIIIHPEFNATSHTNDIALLRLRSMADCTSDRVDVLKRLASTYTDSLTPAICLMTGWGLTLADGWLWPTAADLQELRIQSENETECESKGLDIPEKTFCFKSIRRHASPCMLDEGAPVICKYVNNKWTLVGLYAFSRAGDGCKLGPKGATQISQFKSWIKATMNSE